MGMQNGADTLENSLAGFVLFLMISIELPYDLAILLLGMYLREFKAYVHREMCTQMFIQHYS